MVEKKPDEIMAEYLLNGGKMLAKSCTICGSPLFEWKGETKCVVCETNQALTGRPEPVQSERRDTVTTPPLLKSSNSLDFSSLRMEIFKTIELLCKRINEEPEPQRCLLLMDCICKGVEAFKQLS